jgi:hypothetical protein
MLRVKSAWNQEMYFHLWKIGPVFTLKTLDGKLDSTDAEFVDIIHSDGGALGYFGHLGHVDFYPNGGTPGQPNCTFISTLASGLYSYFVFQKYLFPVLQ